MPSSQVTLDVPTRPARRPTSSGSGNAAEAVNSHDDDTQTPIGPPPVGSRPAADMSQTLIVVSIAS